MPEAHARCRGAPATLTYTGCMPETPAPDDAHFMRLALAEAQAAAQAGEVPVGAVVVKDLDVSLLGQSVLTRMGKIELQGDRMVIEPR